LVFSTGFERVVRGIKLKLETQLIKLAELGLILNPDITIEDLLYSLDREIVEAKPFILLLSLFGAEVERAPWGRRICDRVWSFDPECIDGTGDYVKIVHQLCLLSGNPDYLIEITDYIDLESGDGWLEYTIGERRQHWTIEINDDWADMMTVSYVMEDIQQSGRQFYSIDNGQAMILFYLDRSTAEKLGDLCGEDLEPVIPA
jgi:hypothetical protein